MYRIRLEIPIFQSPTKAYGNVQGIIELEYLPEKLNQFPFPDKWVNVKPSYFENGQNLIMSVSPWEFDDASHYILMYGIVFSSLEEAKECANFFSNIANFEITEY